MTILELLQYEEGYRKEAYHCSEGYPTIGIGTKIGPEGASLSNYQFTVSEKLAKCFLDEELTDIVYALINEPWYVSLNADRQAIIKSMAYQMGISGLFKFRNMIAALEHKDYAQAATEALDSRWAIQTKARAIRHATVLKHGSIDEVYEGLI